MQPEGLFLYKGLLAPDAQAALVSDLREAVALAPLFAPLTPWGKPMRVRMTSLGRFGWYSDRKGYRYVERHPSGVAWPPIPPAVLAIWDQAAPGARAPECCLVNYYAEKAAMGLHQDRDEADMSQPVVSLSLGDPALFRVGGLERGAPTTSFDLESGDVLVMSGAARRVFHGVDRIRFGRSSLLKGGGRINLTLRVVT
ncbi:alpha-ketoglutarate-dependent dioxygenase AlkB [Halovulum dunhuangense]|uniref:Alpha-ketoglutarate-dependent dioxygenase AlkB n=1 Tax=Halovulum dunhuangense TaxID=1505036 RepID=A0A849KPP4_9RHOB|nr:alpha-ketoglutarate-dependent dioxygenase AlkB [Halovulum dunhuangense]NNU79023.1 alpha-ketoglutarate-dependent dioxygenase AlkB [Halovulum dunhuangense]